MVYKSIPIIREESEAVEKNTDVIIMTFNTHFGVTIPFLTQVGSWKSERSCDTSN